MTAMNSVMRRTLDDSPSIWPPLSPTNAFAPIRRSIAVAIVCRCSVAISVARWLAVGRRAAVAHDVLRGRVQRLRHLDATDPTCSPSSAMPRADLADGARDRLAAAAQGARRGGERLQLLAHARHRLEQRAAKVIDVQRGRQLLREAPHRARPPSSRYASGL